jgi:DNA modification methylase
MNNYQSRNYLSAIEAAKYINTTVSTIHELVKQNQLKVAIAASGQQRFDIEDLKRLKTSKLGILERNEVSIFEENTIEINGTIQKVYVRNAQNMEDVPSDYVHLMVTSPPYFDAKMYSDRPIGNDLGNIHSLDEWFEEISKVWQEVHRVLQPGRKAFINIMNLPVRQREGFKSLNLMGKTIDICEKIGFVFKRDIVWHKTNAVRAHFGTYPYPGGILINNMHEFILEFEKPPRKGFKKFAHLSEGQKEQSKLDKDFWLSIKKSDVWVMKPEGSGDNRNHIAPFPYELPYRLVKAYSFVGETVLDPFLGSGTTLKSAMDLRRNGIGYEINPMIAQEAVAALKVYQGQMEL